ncbi:hypothetical protein T4B_7430 [Trichinella pseudospiralis]|uniref:Uncharacterized protein n=1 Tax=Trichinella pseudospiralis TaxID=6337 RepID=A0A0V1INK3_TRIPS|nr:hypothetical protein T4A_11815 [Trichinella pseudospiralis]KRZ24378.1 hypothetical protein T4B_7430 [Trichinella pseudospiralis]KRZ42954.1 hypothetical protein T4C_5588 [Trichinella pseudospiralis]
MYVTRKVKFLRSRFPATQASKEESTNPLLNPDVDAGLTEMDLNPSDPLKVDTDSDEYIVQCLMLSAKTSPKKLRRPL